VRMWQPLGQLFKKRDAGVEEDDIRYFVERVITQMTGSQEVRCVQARGGIVIIKTADAFIQQEVRLLEYDLRAILLKDFSFKMKVLKIHR
jgi:hypothetical protein